MNEPQSASFQADGSGTPGGSTRTLQRPLQRLRNDEVSSARHHIPAVYEALVQYDSLYLNAEARMEAKENELTRCIEVGQEVLLQLHAVRQRCAEMESERDSALDAAAAAERQVAALRQQLKHIERSYEEHYRSTSSESNQYAMQLQAELQHERDVNSTLVAQLDEYKSDQMHLDDEISTLRTKLLASEKQRSELVRDMSGLKEAVASRTQEVQEAASELSACVTVASNIGASLGVGRSSTRNATAATTSELRMLLQELYPRAMDLLQREKADVAVRESLQASLASVQRAKDDAVLECNTLRQHLVEFRSQCTQLESDLRTLRDSKADSPRRAQMLQTIIAEKDSVLADLRKLLEDNQRDLVQKAQRNANLEDQIVSLQREISARGAQTDYESKAMEALQRAKVAEQASELLQQEVAKLKTLRDDNAQLQTQVSRFTARVAEAEGAMAQKKEETRALQATIKSLTDANETANATIAALQSDLYQEHVQNSSLSSELNTAMADLRKLKDEAAAMSGMSALQNDIKQLREENLTLRDSLATIQHESKELQDALTRVALEEQSASTSMIHRVQELEADIEEKQKRLSELQASERQLRHTIREHVVNETTLNEALEEQKRRMSEYLQAHVPSVMFRELERDFADARSELQRARNDALQLQEWLGREQKSNSANTEALAAERQRHEVFVNELRDWEGKLKIIDDHITMHRPSAKALRSAGRRTVSNQSVSCDPPASRPLFADATDMSSGGAILMSPIAVSNSLSISATPSLAATVSSAPRRLLDVFNEATTELRMVLHSILERMQSHRTLPPDELLLASTPQTFAVSMTKLFDVAMETVDSLTDQATKVTGLNTQRQAQVQQELHAANQTVSDLRRNMSQLQDQLQASAAAASTANAELQSSRAAVRKLTEDNSTVLAELNQERSRRQKLERQLAALEEKLDSAQSDVQFEAKSLAARCEQLKQQLSSERQDHQAAMSRVLDEVSTLKQEKIRANTTSHDEYAEEVRRRRSAEHERDGLLVQLQALTNVQEELKERTQRYASMLQTARHEVEQVTATLNDVEDTLQRDIQNATADNESLRAELDTLKQHMADREQKLVSLERQLKEKQQSQTETIASANRLAQLQSEVASLRLRIEEDAHIRTSLEQRCHLLANQNEQLESTLALESKETAALLQANLALEERLEGVEKERDPLRVKLHSLLDIARH